MFVIVYTQPDQFHELAFEIRYTEDMLKFTLAHLYQSRARFESAINDKEFVVFLAHNNTQVEVEVRLNFPMIDLRQDDILLQFIKGEE